MSCCATTTFLQGAFVLGVIFILYKLYKYYQNEQKEKKIKEWDVKSRDKLILHMIDRSPTIPSGSPYVLKLETYLRAAKIPYEIDFTDPFGPKGKTPWISYRGVNMGDSQLIIEFLNKKFDINFNKNYTESQKAIAFTARIMMETHFIWGIASYRWIENTHKLREIFNKASYLQVLFLGKFISGRIKKGLQAVGLAAHTKEEFLQMMLDDLRSLSGLLGTNKFLLGSNVCEEDFAIYSVISQVLWTQQGSPYEVLITRELQNLREYCIRMKEKYWQADWEKVCAT